MNIKSINETMLSLYNMLNTKEVNLNPLYQRTEWVWLVDDQKLLINSIIDDFPIPNLFFHKMSENWHWKYDCVDWKQRLTTIRNFIDWKITVDIDGDEYKYLELPNKYRKNFDKRKIWVHIISNASEKEIKIVFDRLQRGSNLTPSEILKTLDSEYNKKVQEYMNKFKFLKSNSDGSVMLWIRDWNKRSDIFWLVLKIIVLEIEQSDIKTKNIETFLYKYDKILSNQKDKLLKIEKIFKYLEDNLTDEQFNNIKSLYTFVTIYYLLSVVYDKNWEGIFTQLNPFLDDLIIALSTSKKNVPANLKQFIKIKEISQEWWDTKQKILERNNILLTIINDKGITSEQIVDDSYILYNYKNYTDEIYNTINELVGKWIWYKPEVLANYPTKFNELKNAINDFWDFRLFISDAYTIIFESLDESTISILPEGLRKKDVDSILFLLNEFRTFLHHNPEDTHWWRFDDKETRDINLTNTVNSLWLWFAIKSTNDLNILDNSKLWKLKNYLLWEFKKYIKEILAKNI